jgi:molybdopterin/thiamine biosynthesis adenylyltransferase
MSIKEKIYKQKENNIITEEDTFFSNRNSMYKAQLVDTTDQEIFKKILMLRAGVYIDECKFLDESKRDSDGGEKPDEYDLDDDTSHYIISEEISNEDIGKNGYHDGILGTIRAIRKSDGKTLPIEHYFSEEIGKLPNNSVEISRFIVKKKYRAKESQLFASLLLIRAVLFQVVDERAPRVCAVLEEELLAHLRDEIGIPFETHGESKYIDDFDSVNYAVSADPQKIISSIFANDRKLVSSRKNNRSILSNRGYAYGPFMSLGKEDGWQNSSRIDDLSNPQTRKKTVDRNLGFLSISEQDTLSKSCVGIAGVGGDGGRLAVELARLGVGSFHLADPEVFEYENLNRQEGSSYETVGRNKAIVIADEILKINPYANIKVFSEGINIDNIKEFSENINLIIDETEMTLPAIGVLVAQEARRRNIPNLMVLNVGYGSQATSFDPNKHTFEDKLGLPKDISPEKVGEYYIKLDRWLAYIPSYVEYDVFKEVSVGNIPAPSLVQGVDSAASIGATEAIKHLLRKGNPVFYPYTLIHDGYDHITKKVRFSSISLAKSSIRMMFNSRRKH